ncbi:hypothetical protein EMB92_07000 [Bifidobacterium callitrichos]|uniref:Histidine kinase n=1 Tax=Bifidobacterium callitrichos TaxID=762209 RepID=A0A5M9ZCW8_9BIFI|nr:hypothetical protein [Bifidobacterium callitrichos]KAA8816612.1 hypothetical protein EMB92_07000 [Bifidobacterium callitrichos]
MMMQRLQSALQIPLDHLRSHPGISITAAIDALILVLEWLSAPPSGMIMTTVSALLAACIIATPAAPRMMQWIAVACFCVSSLPFGHSWGYTVIQDFSILIAIGILTYLHPYRDGIAAVAISAIGNAISNGIVDDQLGISVITTIVKLALPSVTAWIIGYAFNLHQNNLRIQKIAQEHLAAEQENARLHANAKVAVRMHDTLTNDLSCISAIAHQHPDDPEWNVVLQRSQSAFVQAHAVIDYLSGRNVSAQHTSPFMERLHDQLSETKHYLDFLGYHGEATIHGESLVTTHDAEEETLALLKEIGTNIQRHAVKGREAYILSIDVTPDGVEIFETNDAGQTTLDEAERSGRGLDMHRRQIERLGGVLDTNLDDQLWILHANIPWRPSRSS